MAFSDLLPFNRPRTPAETGGPADPFIALHRDMNRLFDEFTRGFGLPMAPRSAFATTWPQVEVSETETEVKVVAEVPGLEEKDLELSLQDGVLTLKGEKKSETKGPVYSERWQGQFLRSLQLGRDIDPDKVAAAFKNGVLTVTVGKRADAKNGLKHIAISKE
ncbi:MAG TPA: Hsp20/alpha crystallin family protein [Acidisoma sp.]|jgi:HSP20 family protein|uniref:Hsp20/alpha crystallin family protein n=1 Tax=Acidisoma sp. TaxID=1872115 RepID=UPI002C932770|nr:Hsp20/alpha crystallin family protein [Acidisoma sp.]HTI01361.1 Hsp20/alpha crystallin family protein [Acidisoma sp.]